MTTKERLLYFLKYRGVNNRSAEMSAELPNGTINNSKGEFNSDTILKIKKVYEDLNLNWLIAEEEPMLKNNQQIGNIENSTVVGANVNGSGNKFEMPIEQITNSIRYYREIIEKQQEQINELLQIIKNLSSGK
jgi:hypothetical protein